MTQVTQHNRTVLLLWRRFIWGKLQHSEQRKLQEKILHLKLYNLISSKFSINLKSHQQTEVFHTISILLMKIPSFSLGGKMSDSRQWMGEKVHFIPQTMMKFLICFPQNLSKVERHWLVGPPPTPHPPPWYVVFNLSCFLHVHRRRVVWRRRSGVDKISFLAEQKFLSYIFFACGEEVEKVDLGR